MSTQISMRPVLAKFMPPRVPQILARKRLFSRLDAGSQAVWLHGPPGSGKTTLLASYLQHHKIRPLWFQADSDDQEPSTFFHFLAEGVRPNKAKRVALPLVSVETRNDWPGFARRFARALFESLPEGSVLVFDNVQEGGAAIAEIMATMIGELDSSHRIFIISHHAPTPGLSERLGMEKVSTIGAEGLIFSRNETLELARKLGLSGSEALERVYRISNGWAAGIVLCAIDGAVEIIADSADKAPRQVLDYILQNVMEWIPPQTRLVLNSCVFFPDFDTTLACTASGNPDAGKLIADLSKNSFFIEQRGTGENSRFAIHSLLAEAIIDQFGPAGAGRRLEAQAKAGRLLLAAGHSEAGIGLLLAAGQFEEVAPSILSFARAMLSTGREEQFAGWIALLPAPLLEQEPWLEYWRAIASASFDEFRARAVFEEVYRRFERHHDELGMALSSAAVLVAIESGWQSFEGVEFWSDLTEFSWRLAPEFPDAESQLRALLGVLVAIDLAGARLDASALFDSLIKLIKATDNQNLHLQSEIILRQLVKLREFDKGLALVELIDELVDLEKSNPVRVARWLYSSAVFDVWAGNLLRRKDLLVRSASRRKRAKMLAEKYHLTSITVAIAHADAHAAMNARDTAAAGKILAEIEGLLSPLMLRQLAWHYSRHCRLSLLRGMPGDALSQARSSLWFTQNAATPAVSSGFYHMIVGVCLVALEKFDEALQNIRMAIDCSIGGSRKTYEQLELFCLAAKALKEYPDTANPSIAVFFSRVVDWQIFDYGGSLQPQLTELCIESLRRVVEVDKVREMIARRKVVPPPLAPSGWPWPVRIEALGGFNVYLWDKLLVFDGKSQKKPLEMLKFLVARSDPHNPGRGTRIEDVIGELWPNSEAKDPKGSFDVNVHRLRKLLEVEDAIVIGESRLKLNTALVWCDVFDFEGIAMKVLQGEKSVLSGALTLYGGPLFGKGEEVPWAFATGERIAIRFALLVQRQGEILEAARAYPQAIEIYERGLAQDNLIEPFYRGLMRCHIALNEPAAAMRAYRRCRELLSIVLGLKPAPETEVLLQRISGGQGPAAK